VRQESEAHEEQEEDNRQKEQHAGGLPRLTCAHTAQGADHTIGGVGHS
jgi:hypothetical protein